MSHSVTSSPVQGNAGLWWKFPLHQLLSTVGILILAGILTFAVTSSSQARWILTEKPYFPVQTAVAFCVGFALGRYLKHRAMEWVWVLPLLILCVSFGLIHLTFGGRLEHFFGTSCKPELRCFDQLAVTLPFYTAASYSLAAFLSRHFKGRTQQHETAK